MMVSEAKGNRNDKHFQVFMKCSSERANHLT